jgi:hypothetical protein
MPGECHVFDPLLAAILNQRERESVSAGAAKLVDSRPMAAFRGLTACLLDCDSIAGDCNIAPNVAFGIYDIEGVVGFDRPDSTERVCPRPDQGTWTGGRISSACTQQGNQNASENDSERKWRFHAVDPVLWQLKVKLTFISNFLRVLLD